MDEITEHEIVSTASRLIAKYPEGYLSEPELIMWEGWAVAIRGPDVDGLDTPKAIIEALIWRLGLLTLFIIGSDRRLKARP